MEIKIIDSFGGMLDNQWGPVVRGWALIAANSESVWVKVTGDNQVKFVHANEFRKDLVAKKLHKSGHCGFSVDFGKRLTSPAIAEIISPVFQLPMSRPRFVGKPIFFMHIAKTAGSSLNRFFIDHYGKNKATMHIEGVNDWSTLSSHSFISGHIGFQKFETFFPSQNYLKVTFIRKPLNQLISHFNWVRCLSEPENRQFLLGHPLIVHEVSKRLCDIDFSDAEQLKAFVDSMRPVEISLFENCQSRYFYQLEKVQRHYTEKAFQKAKANFDRFDYVGLTENFDYHCKELCQIAGIVKQWTVPAKVNVNQYSYGFDFEDTKLRAILEPLITFDMKLYEYARSKKA